MEAKTEVGYLAYELRQALEQKDAETAEVKMKISRIENELDKHEVKNAELVSKLAEERKTNIELKERYDELEKKLCRLPKGDLAQAAESIEVKVFENRLRWGRPEGKEGFKDYIPNLEQKYYRTDVDSNGGWLAPTEYLETIIKKITEISPVRQVAMVRQTVRDSISIPRRETLLPGYWVGEGAPITEAESTYGMQIIKLNKLAVYSVATLEMLTDAAFNMESEINSDIVERFAQVEGRAFVLGDAVEKPEGIITNPSIEIIPSGVANDITADSIIYIAGQLKVGYNPMYMLNRKTIARIRSLKDGLGQYLWQPGIAQGYPNTINGYPYISAIDVPDIDVNAKPIIFGDFMKGYTVLDGIQMSMIRDDYTLAAQGKIRFIAHRRVGGQVVLDEAIKILKCSVS